MTRPFDPAASQREDLVRHVVIHEASHHFGFSDDEMHALEASVKE